MSYLKFLIQAVWLWIYPIFWWISIYFILTYWKSLDPKTIKWWILLMIIYIPISALIFYLRQ